VGSVCGHRAAPRGRGCCGEALPAGTPAPGMEGGAFWGQGGSSSPADPCQVFWHRVLAADRPHPGCALQDLLEEENRSHLCTAVRQQAMLAIAALRYLPSPCFAWHLSSASGSGPGGGHGPSGQSQTLLSAGPPPLSPAQALSRGRKASGLSSGPRQCQGGRGASRQGSPHHSLRPSQGPLPQRCLGGTAPSPCVRQASLSLCSALEMVPEDQKKDLLRSCFGSVFWLPPKEHMQGLDTSLYHKVSSE